MAEARGAKKWCLPSQPSIDVDYVEVESVSDLRGLRPCFFDVAISWGDLSLIRADVVEERIAQSAVILKPGARMIVCVYAAPEIEAIQPTVKALFEEGQEVFRLHFSLKSLGLFRKYFSLSRLNLISTFDSKENLTLRTSFPNRIQNDEFLGFLWKRGPKSEVFLDPFCF
ncbi:MAG: hypothetical protein AAFQ94_25080 [Bacteroidota bacterium]